MRCKKCNSKATKNGHKKDDLQVYRCTECGYCFTNISKRRLTEEQKDELLARLLKVLDIKVVAEEFDVSERTVKRIIKIREQQE